MSAGAAAATRRHTLAAGAAWAVQATLVALALPLTAAALARGGADPVRPVADALPTIAALSIATLALFAIVEVLDRLTRTDPELARKFAHVGAGIVACAAPLGFTSHWPMLVLTGSFAGLLVVSRRLGALRPLHSPARGGFGDLTYPAGIYAAFLLASGDGARFQIAALILAFADAAAALAGRRAARSHYDFAGANRSLRGSATFLVVALAVCGIVLGLDGRLAPLTVAACAASVALGATTIEVLSPRGLDNFSVPLVASLVLALWL